MSNLSGNVQKIIYYNEDNNYLIGLFKVRSVIDNEDKPFLHQTISITGYLPKLSLDDDYQLTGDFKVHPRYGQQFEVKSYELIKPTDNEAIITFLSSDLFPGVGLRTARKIVENLGADTLSKIEENETELIKLGISEKASHKIHDILKTYHHSHKYIVKLTSLGFKLNDALTIYNHFKKKIDLVINNLYLIPLSIDNISFKKIKQIIIDHNLSYEVETYHAAYLISIIKELTYQTGNTYTTVNSLANVTYRELDLDSLNSVLKYLKKKHLIYQDNKKIWPYELYYDEKCISDFLYLFSKQNKVIKYDLPSYLNQNQKDAVINAFSYNHSVITGGPGTGKTTIIKHIVSLYKSLYPKSTLDDLVLLAPTGKASKRMAVSANYKATTIHRFLKWNKEQDTFDININNPIDVKMLIVDEASMVDTSLLANLIRGVTKDTHLVLVGDYHQLPSIKPGQVLKDIIDSNAIPTTHLNLIYRQEEGSSINILASAIIKQELSVIDELNKHQVTVINSPKTAIKSDIINILNNDLKHYPIHDISILAPKYRGENGIDLINETISNYLLPNQKYIKYGDLIFKEKDKVLLLNNLPDLNIFNGDLGYITDINDQKQTVISFDDNSHLFKYSDLKNFKLGYATSIHKAQGSEFKVVVLIITSETVHMLDQQLIYTAITRAKEKLYLLGDLELFKKAILTKNRQERLTNLKELLKCQVM